MRAFVSRVDADRRLDDLERVAVLAREVRRRGRVLREAGAAEARARVQELRADAPVEAHPLGDVVDVGAHQLAEPRDLVDEGDLHREEAVGGVLDELGRGDVGDHERRLDQVQRAVDLLEDLDRARVAGADDDAVRAQEVRDGRALAQELGIGDDREVVAAVLLLEDLLDHAARSRSGTVDFVTTTL